MAPSPRDPPVSPLNDLPVPSPMSDLDEPNSAPDAPRIFGSFEGAVSAKPYGGLGLGLYIAREIVVAHGGAIEVTSEPSKGARFTVSLPRRTPDPTS